MSPTYLSREGLEKLKNEEKNLLQQKRELTEEVSKAAALGDLRENAEYHAAREKLQRVSDRLLDVIERLTNVAIIDDLDIKDGEARIGTTVTLEDIQAREQFNYLLIGPDEADPAQGRLSIASPLGKQILGKKEGETFTLKLPAALVQYKVIKVQRT